MCSREDVRLPAHRQAPRAGLHRSLSPVNVVCLLLGVVSTAISLGSLLVQRSGSSHAASAKGSERTLAVDGEQELSRKVRFFQELKPLSKDHAKLIWRGDPEDGSSHTIAEKGGYNVYAQITFQGDCSDKDIFLTITLCKKERRVKEKELLITSLSVCESKMDIKWTRTLSQAAIFYFEEGDEIYINTTSMRYVDFNHNYNNIFGIYRI